MKRYITITLLLAGIFAFGTLSAQLQPDGNTAGMPNKTSRQYTAASLEYPQIRENSPTATSGPTLRTSLAPEVNGTPITVPIDPQIGVASPVQSTAAVLPVSPAQAPVAPQPARQMNPPKHP